MADQEISLDKLLQDEQLASENLKNAFDALKQAAREYHKSHFEVVKNKELLNKNQLFDVTLNEAEILYSYDLAMNFVFTQVEPMIAK